jgi:uncharacterized protein
MNAQGRMMTPAVFVKRSRLAAPADEVFAWHARPGAFERLNPPWEAVEVVDRTGGIRDGDRVSLAVKVGPSRLRWLVEHRDYEEGRQFRDVQIVGPFAHWVHTHRIAADGPRASILEDHIEYTPPLGRLGALFGGPLIRRKLERLFRYRHRVTARDLALQAGRQGSVAMNILVTGTHGLIGSTLVPFLTAGGHQVIRLVRGAPQRHRLTTYWDPAAGFVETAGLEGIDAVVHLAGESLVGRWTAAKKARIRDSRVHGTRLLCEALAQMKQPPKVVISASATGYYGNRGDEILSEDSAPGEGFLAGTCRAWEAAAEPLMQRGIRVVHLRFGVVLSPAGGALAHMLLPFRLGGSGVLGSGRQYLSWIALDDAIGAIYHALATDQLQGAINVVTPSALTNRDFTKVLGRVLRRPTLLPMPDFAARLLFGEMADQLLLASTRVQPKRLQDSGYDFGYPDLEDALRHLLGRVR